MALPTASASIVLRHHGVERETDAIAETVAAFAYPAPTWEFAVAPERGEELSLKLVKWLHESGVEDEVFYGEAAWERHTMMDRAAKCGFLSVVDYLADYSTHSVTDVGMEWAAMRGHLHVVKFLNENYDGLLTVETMTSAAWNGHLEIVKYLIEEAHAPFSARAWELAAGKGDLEMVKYFHHVHNNIPDEDRNEKNAWTTMVMKMAGINAKMEVVEWLHENRTEGCDAETFVDGGAAPFVKFLHEHGYPGDRNAALDEAVRCGKQELVEYLRAAGFTGSSAQEPST